MKNNQNKGSKSGFRAANRPPEGVTYKVKNSYFGSIYGQEEKDAVLEAMDQEWLTNGPQTAIFEEEFASYHNTNYAFTTSNCTAALHISSDLLNLQPEDEVITTPCTFIATSQPILCRGSKVIFADIDHKTFNIDPKSIEDKITSNTKAIFLVHDGGHVCDMDPILELAKKHNILILEDAARSPGAEYKGRKSGSFGDVGVFSFHCIKNMTTLGEGGMLITNNDQYAQLTPMLRSMGVKYFFEFEEDEMPDDEMIREFPFDAIEINGTIPRNYRMNESQSAVGRVQLKKLDKLNEKRRQFAHYMTDQLLNIDEITPPHEADYCKHVYHMYTLLFDGLPFGVKTRNLIDKLNKEKGIQSGGGINMPNYLHKLYRDRGYKKGICPIAEKTHSQSFSLPINPRLTNEDVDYMVNSLKSAIYELKHSSN